MFPALPLLDCLLFIAAHKEDIAIVIDQLRAFLRILRKSILDINLRQRIIALHKENPRVGIEIGRVVRLQLSVQPFLGIELFRIELSRDSIKLLDRMNRRYFAENYAGFKGTLPIDFNFYNLQALFLNQLFLPGEKDVDFLYDHFQLERDGLITSLHTEDRMDLHYLFRADNEEKLLSTRISDKFGRYALLWRYEDFQIMEQQKLFPQRMEVSLLEEEQPKGGMSIYYSRIQLDKALRMDFQIPGKYKRVTMDQILKSLFN